MAKLISHRGNLNGRNYKLENTVDYINSALDKGFYVEIDVWRINDTFYLGHDAPNVEVSLDFLENEKFLIHCKNKEAYQYLWANPNKIDSFVQEDEDWVESSNYNIIVHGKHFPSDLKLHKPKNHIIFMWFVDKVKDAGWDFDKMEYGICSDFIETYR